MDYLQQLQTLYSLTAAAGAPAAAATTPATRPPKVLDARPQQQYLNHRLSHSVNVQLPSLTANCYLLPDKPQPFAVVVPSSNTYTITQEPSQHGTQQNDAMSAVFLKGTSSLQEFLTSRGWTAASFLQDCPELWQAAEQLQLLEQHPADAQQLARRCLFAPSQLLEAEIERIEAAFVELRMRGEQQHGQQGLLQVQEGSQQQQQQQVKVKDDLLDSSCCSSSGSGTSKAGAAAAQLRLYALDVGCGSGRDVAWLASRQRVVQGSSASLQDNSSRVGLQAQGGRQDSSGQQRQLQHQQSTTCVCWHVTGVDEWPGALERAADLAAAMQLGAQQVQLVLGSICPQSGDVQLRRLPAKSRLHQAQQVPVVHASALEASSTAPAPAAAAAAGGAVHSHEAPAQASREAATREVGTAAAAAAAAEVTASICSVRAMQYDLILCVRFLERSLLPQLRCMLRPGGCILYCTFVDGPGLRAFGRPSGHEHVLQPGELAAVFGPQHGFQVLRDEVVLSADGRELSWFVAQLCCSSLHNDDLRY